MLWFLLACPHPAPPVDAPTAEVPAQEGATTLTLSSPEFSAPSFTVAELVDLHLTRALDASIVRNAVSGTAHCEGDHCWLDLVHPSEVIELRSPTSAEVVVTPLPPPEPTHIAPGDTVTVEPAPLAHEGALPAADLVFSLDAPATVVLHARPLHSGPDHTGKHLTDVAIFGGWGREQASVFGQVQGEPGVHKNTWTLSAGEWRVRVRGESPGDREMYCFSDPELGLFPPTWCAEETAPLPYPIELVFVSAEPVELEGASAGIDN